MSSATTYEHRPGFVARQINSISLMAEQKALALSPLSLRQKWLRQALQKSAARLKEPNVSALLVESVLQNALSGFVSPAVVTGQLGKYVLHRGHWELPSKYFVIPGDWDVDPLSLEENPTYQTMKSVLAHRHDFDKNDIYRQLIERVASEGTLKFNGRVLSAHTDVDDYFQTYVDIAQSIERDGFNFEHEKTGNLIGVVLDRNGNFLHFRRGHHRIALAKILRIPKIKVRVLAIHPGFASQFQQAGGDILENLETAVLRAFERAET